MQTVVETPGYLADAHAAKLSDAEREKIVSTIAADPKSGVVMEGTGGARKVRFAREGSGKSGGYRVVTFYGGDDIPVFLLNVFAKNEKANLTKRERNELKRVLSAIPEAYRGRRKR